MLLEGLDCNLSLHLAIDSWGQEGTRSRPNCLRTVTLSLAPRSEVIMRPVQADQSLVTKVTLAHTQMAILT